MYDDADASSFVTSNVVTLSAKSGNRKLEIRNVTFEQKVKPVTFDIINPKNHTDADDASRLSYHRVSYTNVNSDLCIVVKPVGNKNERFEKYDIYLKFDSQVDILHFDSNITIKKENKWMTCVRSEDLRSRVGTIYIGVAYEGTSPGIGKCLCLNYGPLINLLNKCFSAL